MAERTYFDWNATSPLRGEAREAMRAALALTGNPSSVHAEGRLARRIVEEAREAVARFVGAEAKNVTFTSGATEANTLALTPALEVGSRKEPRDILFVSAIEHPSVLCGGRFPAERVKLLPVRHDGLIDVGAARQCIAEANRPLVSVMQANNETGVIQPVRDVAEIVHAAGGLLHVDAVQGAGRIDCTMDEIDADLLTVSSHKLGGPQGAGALIRRGGIQITDPLIRGGGQERGLRGGTENVAGIAGFAAACVAAAGTRQRDAARMAALRDRFESALKAATPEAIVFGGNAPRLPNTTMFAVPGLKAETAIIAFDLNGIAVSSGAACSSGKVQASHVLAAMGVEPALARGGIRVSLGWSTTEADVDILLTAWNKLVSSLLNRQANAA